jgi:ubiquinone/menaquinone biosynthesis C-methylase UbiE
MQSDPEMVERYFHNSAPQFDALYDETRDFSFYVNRLFRSALYKRVQITLDELRERQDYSVLDVGCGSGRNAFLFERAGASRVVGVDFARGMIDLAEQRKASQMLNGRCEFICADVFSHKFSGKFDVVVALGVFDYTKDPRELLSRMIKLSANKVIGSFPCPSLFRAPFRKFRYTLKNCPVYFFSRRELRGICADVGLREYKLVPCSRAGHILVGTLGDTWGPHR